MTNAKQQYFEAIEKKNEIEATYEKHRDFYYQEAVWNYDDETLTAMREEIEKLNDVVKSAKALLKAMRIENDWNLEELREMRKEYQLRNK